MEVFHRLFRNIGITVQKVSKDLSILTQKICSIPLLAQEQLAAQRYGIAEGFYSDTICILLESFVIFHLLQSIPGWCQEVEKHFHQSVFDKQDIRRKLIKGFLEKLLEPFLLIQKRQRILKWFSDVKLDWQRARLKSARTSFTRLFLGVI